MVEGRTTGRGWTRGDLYEERLGRRRSDMLERRELEGAERRLMNREYVAWDSPNLRRRMELLYFGHGWCPMIWFSTSLGRFFLNEAFGMIGAGATDNILSGTTDMIRILNEKGIRHRSSVWDAPYGHDWPWWKEQIRHYVP